MHLIFIVCVLHNDTIDGNTLICSRMILPLRTGPLMNRLARSILYTGQTAAPNIVIQAPDGGKDGPPKTLRQHYVVPAMPPLSQEAVVQFLRPILR